MLERHSLHVDVTSENVVIVDVVVIGVKLQESEKMTGLTVL